MVAKEWMTNRYDNELNNETTTTEQPALNSRNKKHRKGHNKGSNGVNANSNDNNRNTANANTNNNDSNNTTTTTTTYVNANANNRQSEELTNYPGYNSLWSEDHQENTEHIQQYQTTH
ncbi:hypothetical protein RFI_21177, partial [Reticulomyxa filosa]